MKLWINLPVKDILESKKFYREIGFRFNPLHEKRENMIGLLFGEQEFVVMLFLEKDFSQYSQSAIADTSKVVETMLSFNVESKEEVHAMVEKVKKAGGKIFSKPQELGNMYGAGFIDPDGHRWNILYMGENFK